MPKARFCLMLFFLLALSLTALAETRIEKIAESSHQWTGVAVSKSGRIFVNFPTWNDYPDGYRVAELAGGREVPYPSAEANKDFICVQSVVADDAGRLWILDPAKLRGQQVDESGAKLFEVDLATDKIVSVYVFDKTVARPQSYLNDVRVDTRRGFAYMTDSGLGGIVVLDLESKKAWRALTDIPEVMANLKSIDFVSTGRQDHVSESDGIELSPDGDTLYFTALGGDILYAVDTATLRDTSLSVSQRQKKIRVLTRRNVPTDGMVLKDGKLYMADLPLEKIRVFDLAAKKGHDLDLSEKTIRWADSFALAADGSIYFTTSQINYPPEKRVPYGLYRLWTE